MNKPDHQSKPGKLIIKLDEQQLRQICAEMAKRFEAYRAQLNALDETTKKGRRRCHVKIGRKATSWRTQAVP
jgi:hypothetical protein